MENRGIFLVIPLKSIFCFNFNRKLRRSWILLLFIVIQIFGISVYARAQQVSVKGTVKDQKGETLVENHSGKINFETTLFPDYYYLNS